MTESATHPEVDRQLPSGEEIFLDHVGHFVREPQAASRALEGAGFAPAPVSIQVNPDPAGGAPRPTGTGNVTAMFSRGYIEILFKTANTPIGNELDAALARYSGVHLAAFCVADAAAAHRRLEASGFRVRPLVFFERPVTTEAGAGTAAFTVARVERDEMAEGRIQILTHRTEDMVWQKRWLNHPNGVTGLLDIVIAVADVDEAAGRFARFTNRAAAPGAMGCSICLDRGRIELLKSGALVDLLPDIAIPRLPFIAGYALRTASLDRLMAALRQGGINARRNGDVVVASFPAALGIGVWWFVENPAALPWRRQQA